MRIRWFGHSCFLLTNADGKKLLTDPFDPSVGYPVPKEKVDVVTMSHGHHDHNWTRDLPRPFASVSEVGETELSGFKIRGIHSFHDDAEGAKRGDNVIFVIESDGERVAHLGDLGHMLTDAQFEAIGKIDALLIPIGGYYTIDSDTAYAIAQRIAPRVTIAMHFKTPEMRFPITDEMHFLSLTGGKHFGANEIDLSTCEGGTWALDFQ
ncbi:MAG: MBL fold metallo-hydrolase [Christensenellales bacterium]|jgi:L-ascorbate metabolism protein UlaG (beta-lactamase superfamily)